MALTTIVIMKLCDCRFVTPNFEMPWSSVILDMYVRNIAEIIGSFNTKQQPR